MSKLPDYVAAAVKKAGKSLQSGEIFSKILTTNDDSGRHGVLVPSDAYSFFPDLSIPDPKVNVTGEFSAFDVAAGRWVTLAYKYYERYPERRITRLSGLLNDRVADPRIVVFFRVIHLDGSVGYYFDCENSAAETRFSELFEMVFGKEVTPKLGIYVVRAVDFNVFKEDEALGDLLDKFDDVRGRGWIDSLREGDTGIGYTFESLLGIKENNDKRADFRGIEIKCKGTKEGASSASGKLNLFQQGPVWTPKRSNRQVIQLIGKAGEDGLYRCHSQLTTIENNLGLFLSVQGGDRRIDLQKKTDTFGYWDYSVLEARLAEKHSRAAIIKAAVKKSGKTAQFRYDELLYCERPSIQKFVGLVESRNIVFEFLMSQNVKGSVRNHGYPWRLVREEFLDNLFSFQIKLR